MAEDDENRKVTRYTPRTPISRSDVSAPAPGSVLQSWRGRAEKIAAAWDAEAGNRLHRAQVEFVQLATDYENSAVELGRAKGRRGNLHNEIAADTAAVNADLAETMNRIANAQAEAGEVQAASAARKAQYEADRERALADKAKAAKIRQTAEAELEKLTDPAALRSARITQLAELMAHEQALEGKLEALLMDDDEKAVLKARNAEAELLIISDMVSRVRQKLLEIDGLE
jgi:hypothetical protein